MGNEVFFWEPFHDNRRIREEFNVLITGVELGYEQRREKSAASRLYLSYSYDRELGDNIDAIADFLRKRKGSYESFFLPTWKYESYIVLPLTANEVTFYNRERFAVTAGMRGNYAFFSMAGNRSENEVMRIDSFGATTGLVYMSGALTYAYPIGTRIHTAVKSRLFNPGFDESYISKGMFHLDLNFVEVFGE